MNIAAKFIIASALLSMLPASGAEPKMSKPASVAALSKAKPEARSTRGKSVSNAAVIKAGADKADARKPVVAKIATPAAEARNAAPKLTPSEAGKLLALINQGTTEELVAIKGIAETRAESIREARPFKSIDDLLLVPGIGGVTIDRIIEHGVKSPQPVVKSAKS